MCVTFTLVTAVGYGESALSRKHRAPSRVNELVLEQQGNQTAKGKTVAAKAMGIRLSQPSNTSKNT